MAPASLRLGHGPLRITHAEQSLSIMWRSLPYFSLILRSPPASSALSVRCLRGSQGRMFLICSNSCVTRSWGVGHGELAKTISAGEAFSTWLRTGRRVKDVPIEVKFNPWHDREDGRFTFAGQGNYFPRGGGSRRRRLQIAKDAMDTALDRRTKRRLTLSVPL